MPNQKDYYTHRVEEFRLAGMDKPPIRVWAFRDAPEFLKNLSDHGGDEDYIAILPPGVGCPYLFDEGGRFGCCSVDEYEHPLPQMAGWKVLIGAHA